MQVNYKYPSSSMCLQQGDQTVLGFSPDLAREERVSFVGRLKHPLVFRDAMLMLREIVINDTRVKKKERVEFFTWLQDEIERRVREHEQFMPDVRDELKRQMRTRINEIAKIDEEMAALVDAKNQLQKQINDQDVWRDYYRLERQFWSYLRGRDMALWFVLDPVITVHPDQVSFEAFSLDESTYGCLSIQRDEFEIRGEPQLGTTNIDFSAKLAREMERFRTYTDVELSVNPGGFTVDSGVMPEYLEKKIELPETWIKGFNQVSAAASLGGIDIELSPTDMYDICSFLRRHKARKSPRYMKWILNPGQRIQVILEPWGSNLELQAVYNGEIARQEKIWGRRRWLVLEKIIPLANKFTLRLLGFGMPQFIVGDLGSMKMTVGFTAWSANDWVRGTAFNIMAGFIGQGAYEEVYKYLKEKRVSTVETALATHPDQPEKAIIAGLGMLLRKGEAYYDPLKDVFRFRQLTNIPIPEEIYAVTDLEREVEVVLKKPLTDFLIQVDPDMGMIISNQYLGEEPPTTIKVDPEGQISKVQCKCRTFQRGPRNISAPCEHLLALYVTSMDYLELPLEPDHLYDINTLKSLTNRSQEGGK